MLIIGICGASGSGKSTLADELARRLDEPCVLLKQDSYYKDHPDMDFAQRERINYDEPEAFEHEALRADLEALRAGRSITRKGYDYKQHRRCDSQERICPADVVLLDGNPLHLDPREVNVVKGDGKCASIAAASLVAKVARDHVMEAYAEQYPGYGFESNKGYGSEGHMAAIRERGLCPIHRRSFCSFAAQESLF